MGRGLPGEGVELFLGGFALLEVVVGEGGDEGGKLLGCGLGGLGLGEGGGGEGEEEEKEFLAEWHEGSLRELGGL